LLEARALCERLDAAAAARIQFVVQTLSRHGGFRAEAEAQQQRKTKTTKKNGRKDKVLETTLRVQQLPPVSFDATTPSTTHTNQSMPRSSRPNTCHQRTAGCSPSRYPRELLSLIIQPADTFHPAAFPCQQMYPSVHPPTHQQPSIKPTTHSSWHTTTTTPRRGSQKGSPTSQPTNQPTRERERICNLQSAMAINATTQRRTNERTYERTTDDGHRRHSECGHCD